MILVYFVDTIFYDVFLLPSRNANMRSDILLLPPIALGTMLWMIIRWITECVPLRLTGLLSTIIFMVTGILTADQALPKFSDPILWIFISGFVLVAAFKKSGLDKRFAFKLALINDDNNPKIAIFL